MDYNINVKDKRAIKRLYNSKRFKKYPDMFLSNTCTVRVNADDALNADEFIISSKYRILPRKIYLYGKKARRNLENNNNLYCNYWLDIFFKTIEEGNICKYDFEKADSIMELSIGLTREFRMIAFNHRTWTRQNIITFLSCLFNNELEEVCYEQADLLESLYVA